MICGPFARGSTLVRVIWKTLAPFVAVPLFNAAEPRPDSIDRVLGIRAKISELSREHCRAACSIDDPVASSRAFHALHNSVHRLSVPVILFKACDLCRTP